MAATSAILLIKKNPNQYRPPVTKFDLVVVYRLTDPSHVTLIQNVTKCQSISPSAKLAELD